MGFTCCFLASFTGVGSFLLAFLKTSNLFATVGLLFLIYNFFQIIKYLIKRFNILVLKAEAKSLNHSLKNGAKNNVYGSWALITGSTDGIGKSYANILSRDYKLNLVLVSRNSEKLLKVKDELRKKNAKNLIIVITHDFEKDNIDDLMAKIEAETSGLDLRILVNNVGQLSGGPKFFADRQNQEHIDRLLKVNITSQTRLTHYFMKRWEKSCSTKKSLCINLSSFSALFPMPLMGIYPATKQFNKYLPQALNREQNGGSCEEKKDDCCGTSKKITFQVIEPGYVCTGHHPIAKKPSLMIPTSDQLVTNCLNAVGHLDLTTGHFPTDLYASFVRFMAGNFLLKYVADFLVQKEMMKNLSEREKNE